MVLKLVGELELKDVDIRTSTIEARKLFLNLIWQISPETVIDLMRLFNIESIPTEWQENQQTIDSTKRLFMFHTQNHYCYSTDLTKYGFKSDVRKTPVLAYFDFIFKNQAEFDELLEKSEEYWKTVTPDHYTDLITGRAIEELIPNWQALKSKSGSEWLCSELSKWAEKWNLTDDWCLDFALDCLKNFKIKLIDQYQLPNNYIQGNDNYSLWELNSFWYRGKAWEHSLSDADWQDVDRQWFVITMPDYPLLQYIWNVEGKEIFRIEGKYIPLLGHPDDFRERTDKQFWSKFFEYFSEKQHLLVENNKLLTDELRKFQQCVNDHISKARIKLEPYSQDAVIKRSGDLHFRWLIEYQIPPFKSYHKLSEEHGVESKAIRYGIESVSNLLGLTLRPAKRTGRPKGVKETGKRRNFSHW